MLGPTYRFQVLNSTGQTIAASSITVIVKRWKFAADGSITTETPAATVLSSGSTLATATYLNGTIQDNTVDKYLGATVEFTVTAPASASGNVTLYLQRSVDGGTTWGDDGAGVQVAVLAFTTSGLKRVVRYLG